jgi:thymidylate synthase ThyX
MAFAAKILADSLSLGGVRLTTFEATFPRCILAEVNTHRMLSRNAASSRAIPVEKMIQRVLDNPFIPEFRLNQKGMQAAEALDGDDADQAKHNWLAARDQAVANARQLHRLNIHKQYVNRLLEPWMWCTMIISATDWANFFALRCHPDAEPSFERIAGMMRNLLQDSKPKTVGFGDWHLPLIFDEDGDEVLKACGTVQQALDNLCQISAGRCARVSYLTHNGQRDHSADIELHDRLAKSGHWSPFEHVATPAADSRSYVGNFRGWIQLRNQMPGECYPEGIDA